MVYIVTFVFILLDMATGIIKAFKEKNYTSSIMREGLFHKCGSILCVALGVLVDYAQVFIDLGFNVKTVIPICGYICLMEVGSIIENVGAINPQLFGDKMRSYFQKLSKK